MRVLLLAAGLGTRLRPLTDSIPKCLVRVHGRPLLEYWLDLLFAHPDMERILINTHYLADAVREFVHGQEQRQRIDLVHEPSLLGTGGTVLRNREYFGHAAFMLAHADNLTRFGVGDFLESHRRRPAGTDLTMMTFATDDPSSCGIVELDHRGVVQAFHEKVDDPPGNRANAAVYILEPCVVDFIQSLNRPVVDVSTEVLPHFMGRMNTFHNADYHRDIGTPESLGRANEEFSPVGVRA